MPKKPKVCPRCEGTGREPSEYLPEPCSDCGGQIAKEYRERRARDFVTLHSIQSPAAANATFNALYPDPPIK